MIESSRDPSTDVGFPVDCLCVAKVGKGSTRAGRREAFGIAGASCAIHAADGSSRFKAACDGAIGSARW